MTHDRVRQLVRRINPIPDPSVLETVDVPVPRLERSKDMQVDERPKAGERPRNRWRGPLVGIAAAAVVLAGGVIFINTDQNDVATPAPNATQIPGSFQAVAPGAYFVDIDGIRETTARGTFVIEADGWEGLRAGTVKFDAGNEDIYVSMLVVEVDQVLASPCEEGVLAPAGASAKALADQFAAMPGFVVREPLTPVSAFGSDGYHLALEVPGGCTGETFTVWHDPVWDGRYYQAEGQIEEFWFLELEGITVMVETTRFPDSSETDVAELEMVLDTLVITP